MKLIPLTLALSLVTSTVFSVTTLPAPVTTKMKIPALSKHAGSVVAINETYILSGSYTSPNGALNNAGDVMVFRVSDGSFVRRIVSPFPSNDGNFGRGLALYGGIAYIGAPGEAPSPSLPGTGAVYAYDIATGKVLWLALGRGGQKIGDCLSVSGDLLAVGGPAGALSGAPSSSGSVAVLDRKNGSEVVSIKMPAAAAGDAFGDSVALQGRLLAVGAPFRESGGLNNAGEVLLVDAITQQVINTISAGNKQAGAEFGLTLALCKDVLIVGSPFWDNGGTTDAGFVYLFNTDGTANNLLYLSTAAAKKNFGRSLAAAGNMVLVGGNDTTNGGEAFLFDVNDKVQEAVEVAPHTSTDAVNFGGAVAMTEQALVIGDSLQPIAGSSNQGALWLGKSMRQILSPYYRYAKTNTAAPNCNGALYSSFAEPTLVENNASIMFRAGLKGPGVTAANNSAVFNDWSTQTPELIVRRGDKVGGKTVSGLSRMFFDPTSNAWPVIQTTTGGVTALLRDDGTNLFTDVRVGGSNSDATIASIQTISSAGSNNGTSGFVYTAKTGVKGITSASDSRLGIFVAMANEHIDVAWEGLNLTLVEKIGQISPRLATSSSYGVIHAGITGPIAGNGLLKGTMTNTMWPSIARKGDPAPGAGGNFSTFIGEGINDSGKIVFRATTTNALEGLWMYDTLPIAKIAVKGDPAPGSTVGLKFNRITRFFIANNNAILFTATVTGPGVTTANDQGLWLSKGGTLELIIREGDAAPDCDGARVGTISAVDLGTLDGQYSILTTLTGSTSTNQALFFGDTNKTTRVGRMPVLNVRKGSWIDQPSGQRITSLFVGTHNIDTAGSGSKGNVRLVSSIGALVKVTYSDTVQELMTIRP